MTDTNPPYEGSNIFPIRVASDGQSPIPEDLKRKGGGGTFDGMEPRIAKLEAQMEHALAELSKLAGLPESVGRMDERVKALPDKDYLRDAFRHQLVSLSILVSIIGVIIGVVVHFLPHS